MDLKLTFYDALLDTQYRIVTTFCDNMMAGCGVLQTVRIFFSGSPNVDIT